MNAAEFARVADEAAATAKLGTPSARKGGRNPNWPYVPVIVDSSGTSTQIKGLAFKTRDEAVDAAKDHIARARRALRCDFDRPNKRALREWHGLPRELSRAAS